MPRRVAVVAELEAGQYIAEARAMKAETAAVDREMGQLDRSIDAVDRDMAELTVATTAAKAQVDDLGDNARSTAAALAVLDARIKATRLSVRELNVEVAGTGGEDATAMRKLAQERRLLSRLEQVRSDIEGAAKAGAGGLLGGTGGLRGLTMPVMVGAVGGLITAVIAALPTLGAMIAGVVSGAIGTGGVAGGLLMAVKDPHVRAAASEFGDSIAEEFFKGGDTFAPLAIKSMHILEDAFKGLDLGDSFAKVAPDVEIITQGIVALVEQAMPGLDKAFERMQPFADAAAEGFSDIGTAIGSFAEASTSSEGAVMGLRAAFNLIAATITGLGALVHDLSEAFIRLEHIFHVIVEIGIKNPLTPPNVKDALRGIDRELDDLETGIRNMPVYWDDGSHAIQSFGETIDETTRLTNQFNKAIDKTYTAFLDFVGAEINVEDALDRLQQSFLENGATLDVHTEKGRENLELLKRYAEGAMEAARTKLIETGSVEEANAVYEHYRQELFDMFIQMGKTTEEAQALTDKWLALQKLEDIEKFVNINVRAQIRMTIGAVPNPWGSGFQEFDEGGTVKGPWPGAPVAVVAHAGEEVLNQRDAAAYRGRAWMGGAAAFGSGAQWVAQPFNYSGSNDFEAALIESIRNAVDARGGQLAVLKLKAPV